MELSHYKNLSAAEVEAYKRTLPADSYTPNGISVVQNGELYEIWNNGVLEYGCEFPITAEEIIAERLEARLNFEAEEHFKPRLLVAFGGTAEPEPLPTNIEIMQALLDQDEVLMNQTLTLLDVELNTIPKI